ncbi:UNVERIFIED_ORG: hypothetical protein J2Y81_007985 [Paraburkholderia sediminicola]|nr:hypothetical protein [Paraburkholderia sediminicola]
MMDRSLRLLVERWLGTAPATPARITRFDRMRSNQRRYVCVEALRQAVTLTVFFFVHDDGTWRVVPPYLGRSAMSTSSSQAGIVAC